jgi:hypothetical protein
VPIVEWLFVTISFLQDAFGVKFSVGDSFVPMLFLIAAWGYAVIAIPISFFIAHKPTNDQSFLWLRILAMINLFAPVISAST